jgi:CheY-like chemotaxis protein
MSRGCATISPGLLAAVATRVPMSAGKVLVVDDEPEVRQVLHEFLASRGYDVSVAGDGVKALGLVESVKPDLVLLDVAMPGMDGVETLKRIVALNPTLPVIMVTANADISVTSKLLALGAVDYVPKPFDLEYLDQAVSIQVTAAQDQ